MTAACIRQFFRPERPIGKKGVGDCTKCMPDEANKKCSMFYKISISKVEVSECSSIE